MLASQVLDVTVQVVRGDAASALGYCRAVLLQRMSWQDVLDEVARKCCLPRVLLTDCAPTLNGLPLGPHDRMRRCRLKGSEHHQVLVLTTCGAGADSECTDAAALLEQQEGELRRELDAMDAARRAELAEKEAADVLFVAALVAEETAASRKPVLFMCPICRDDECPVDGSVTLSCNHRYCRDCFIGYVESKIGEKAVDERGMQCALPECSVPITPHEISGHVTAEVNLKYLNFAAEVSIEADPNHVRCPRCSFLSIFPSARKHPNMWRNASCANHNCKFKYCALCKAEPHDTTCEAYAKWKEENGQVDESFLKLMREQQWSKCPHCGMPVVLEEGCFFMTCKAPCCKNFCYICGCKLEKTDHYSHFPTGPFKRVCKNKPAVPGAAAAAAGAGAPVLPA